VTERTEPGHLEDGVWLTRKVLRALPPLNREDEAVAAIMAGTLKAAELLQEDDIGPTEP
jgi:hypothetical protein